MSSMTERTGAHRCGNRLTPSVRSDLRDSQEEEEEEDGNVYENERVAPVLEGVLPTVAVTHGLRAQTLIKLCRTPDNIAT